MTYLTLGLTYKHLGKRLGEVTLKGLMIFILFYIVIINLHEHFHLYDNICQMSIGKVVLYRAFVYLLFSIFAIWIVINLLKRLPKGIHWLLFIGRYSLVFYFLNGGVITVVSAVCNKIGFGYDMLGPLGGCGVFILSSGLLYLCSIVISRFAPWMIGDFK
ncbi:MAG: hypothetical protein ACI4CA_09760 [Bacteroides sp.]